MAASSATNATGNTALAFPIAARASTGRTLRSFVDPGPVRRSTLGNRPHRHHRPLGGWETMGKPWMVDGERLCCSWLRIYGDGSKPWYLVNPKIAGKWMFIPLKMYL